MILFISSKVKVGAHLREKILDLTAGMLTWSSHRSGNTQGVIGRMGLEWEDRWAGEMQVWGPSEEGGIGPLGGNGEHTGRCLICRQRGGPSRALSVSKASCRGRGSYWGHEKRQRKCREKREFENRWEKKISEIKVVMQAGTSLTRTERRHWILQWTGLWIRL